MPGRISMSRKKVKKVDNLGHLFPLWLNERFRAAPWLALFASPPPA
jgi:hypothetical protein